MPVLDGLQTSRMIRENKDLLVQPKIILISALDMDWADQEMKEIGINGILTKPLFMSSLHDTMMRAFGIKGRGQKIYTINEDLEGDFFSIFGHIRILLVEDNPINQQVAKEILEQAGISADLAENGLESIKMVSENIYDAILMDVHMPVMDGIEATIKIRSMEGFSTLPIIAMAANAMKQDIEYVLEVGMNDHISKPINIKLLFSTLKKWVAVSETVDFSVLGSDDKNKQDDKIINMRKIIGLNVDKGLEYLNYNSELYRDMLNEFYRDYQHKPKYITELIMQGKVKEVYFIAHSIRSVAGTLGFDDLFLSAEKLEKSLKNNTEPVDPSLSTEFIEKINQSLFSLSIYLSRED